MTSPLDKPPVAEGDVLAGKYRVDGVLGVGGMGVVVAATHIQLGQRVAVKFLLPEALTHHGALERFAREARAAARLKSDHSVRVIDVGAMDHGAPYMVMELLEGSDLGAVIGDNGPLRIEDAVEYVLQACDAISEAHALGIVHRDLKPRNLFLTRKKNGAACVKVLDFGISKITTVPADHALTKTSEIMGSPNYMAPEQIRSSRDVDERADVWALGVILYELLSGRVPFLSDTVLGLCALILEEEPTPLGDLRSDLPPELTHIVNRCLAKAPDARFRSVSELASALAQFVAQPAVASTIRWESEHPPPGKTASSVRKHGSSARVMVTGGTSAAWGDTDVGKAAAGKRGSRFAAAAVAVVAIAVVGTIGVMKMRGERAGDGASVSASAGASAGASVSAGSSAGASPSAAASNPIASPVASASAMPSASAKARGAPPHATATTTASAKPPATANDLPSDRK